MARTTETGLDARGHGGRRGDDPGDEDAQDDADDAAQSAEMNEDSIRNWKRMSRRRAPTAIRMPISLVRSVTETSMMFMMTMPPTMRAIEEMAIMAK